MTRRAGLVLVTSAVLLTPHAVDVQTKQYPLESADGLRLHNVQAAPVTHEGRKSLRVTMTEETARRAASMTQAERNQNPVRGADQPTLIVNDVKSGPNGSGAVALWIDPGTVAHFRNLTVQPSATASSATKARSDVP